MISAPAIGSPGEPGVLYLAKPLDACSTLESNTALPVNSSSPFVLIIRGGCSFEDKVRRAQMAGFKAAIIYDNEDGGGLIASNDFLHYYLHAHSPFIEVDYFLYDLCILTMSMLSAALQFTCSVFVL